MCVCVWGGYGTAVGGDYLMGPSNRLSARGEAEDFLFFSFPRQGQTEGSSVLWHTNTLPLHQIHS